MLVPQIAECDIVHDHTGPTHNNGAFMIYESMKWKENHLVTIKRLHSSLMEMGQVDLLIEELDMLRKVNHFPFILGLMGICPSENAESLMLMFERAQVGSLFNILHEITLSKMPKLKSITEIALSVCDALIYLHEKNIYHCYVSSHSVILTSLHTAKLANLEYAVEKLEIYIFYFGDF
jgi:inactive serine/threonine-protein kinase TEX14